MRSYNRHESQSLTYAATHHPALPAAERGAVPERVPAAAHLRAALPRDGGRRARRRSDHRDGAAAAGLGGRLRGTAADLRRRLRRPDHPCRADCTTAATTSCCAAWRSSGSASEDHAAQLPRRGGRADPRGRWPSATATSMRAERRRLEALLVPQPAGRGVDPKCRRRCPTRIWSTRSRSTSSSRRSRSRRCSSATACSQRCRSLIELLEMKVLVSRHDWGVGDTSRSSSSIRSIADFGRSRDCRLEIDDCAIRRSGRV